MKSCQAEALVEPAAPQATAKTLPPASSLPVDELGAGTRVGQLVIEHKVGEGGMGTVYAAYDSVTGQRVAIKLIRADVCTPPARQRFLHEAHLVHDLKHPNIVKVHSIGEFEDRRPYLVMELLEGEALAARLAARRASPFEAIEILLQICAALETAHAHGVVHRDLKPENVFLTYRDGQVVAKLLDFGIAKLMDGSVGGPALTRTGFMIGTPAYVSPEQARGRDVDHRTDIYSLGVIAYEMFLEDVPFAAESAAELIAMHLYDDPELPCLLWPNIPRELERLLLEMLHKAANRRPTLAAVVATLQRVRDGFARRAGASATAQRLRPRTRSTEGSDLPPMRGSRSQFAAVGLERTVSTSAASDRFTVDHAKSRGDAPRRRRRTAVGALLLAGLALIAMAITSRSGREPTAIAATLSAPTNTSVPGAVALSTDDASVQSAATISPSLTIGVSDKNARTTKNAPTMIDGTVLAERARPRQRHLTPGRLQPVAPARSRGGHRARGVASAVRDQSAASTSRRRSKHTFDPDGIMDPFEPRR